MTYQKIIFYSLFSICSTHFHVLYMTNQNDKYFYNVMLFSKMLQIEFIETYRGMFDFRKIRFVSRDEAKCHRVIPFTIVVDRYVYIFKWLIYYTLSRCMNFYTKIEFRKFLQKSLNWWLTRNKLWYIIINTGGNEQIDLTSNDVLERIFEFVVFAAQKLNFAFLRFFTVRNIYIWFDHILLVSPHGRKIGKQFDKHSQSCAKYW